MYQASDLYLVSADWLAGWLTGGIFNRSARGDERGPGPGPGGSLLYFSFRLYVFRFVENGVVRVSALCKMRGWGSDVSSFVLFCLVRGERNGKNVGRERN